MEAPKMPEKRNNEKIYLGVIAALSILCAVLSWQLFESKSNYQNISVQRDTVEKERNQLKEELSGMLKQYDQLKTNNKEITAEMQAQRQQIEDLLGEIDKNKGNVTLIGKYKREVTTLRTIMKSYVVTIDSLNTLNKQLFTENTEVKNELGNVKNRAQELQGKNEEMNGIIAKASVLKTYSLSAGSLRVTTNGRQQETDRATKAEIFRLCFKVGENSTARPGSRTLYLRVVKPDGSVVTGKGGGESISSDGGSLLTSSRKDIDYRNDEIELCMYANAPDGLTPGTYTLQLFESGTRIGSTTISLK
ncbi:MAG: hypothetical protein V4616_06305 [Bacteroidota bacterium]